jgi:hypothetical protein
VIITPLDSPSVILDRFNPELNCDGKADFQYISRYSKTYNRVDVFCLEETYQKHVHEVKPIELASCPINYCGFSTSFKGYPVEAGLLRSVASYARINELKKESQNLSFQEVINNEDINIQLTKSKAITKFKLSPEVECSSLLKSQSVNVHTSSISYPDNALEYADHTSTSTIFFEHRKIEEGYEMLAVFENSFNQNSREVSFQETIKCQHPTTPISLYESSYEFLIYPETYYLWGIIVFPK